MIDVKIIKKAKQGHVSVGGGIATAGNSYTTGIQQTLADVLNFNAAVSRLLQPYDANNQPLAWAQATDPDGDGGIKAKTLRAAVTFASVGDIVAYQNGNLSGGTGGGGLDITALEDYLTTNGYATQAWVSAHFNDYVLTKAAVEAVLTGNITSHTHSQYLTEHQSLANYMTRGEIGDTYQAKSTALSFSAAGGYVAARFTNTALATSAAQNYIELWGNDGWFNLQAGSLLAHGAVTATSFVKTGGTATQFLKADGSVDSNSYLLSSAYTAADILTKIKTVDGAGSGLDADTLDGVHEGAFFRMTRGTIPTTYIDLTDYAVNATGYANYAPGTYSVRRTGSTELFVNLAHNGFGSTSALQFLTSYDDASVLKFRKTIDSNRVSGPWRTILTELNIGLYNAGSATKLQTARTIWGQSFNGTANVSGSLSGVEDISFNADAKIAATANHIRLLTKSGGPQGLAVGGLLASDLYADWAKVPAYGIYSKGNISTDGTIKIGGGTITWDAGNNAFIFSHTVASQGDMVAFQNGSLSGGTCGGGLDITALESYLTTNGYATQAWVSAHFNDYVLTKDAVEAVLTGNITSHTHSQYLTAHQSLANYYTKTEADGKYLTAITKSMVEAVLTGNITTHTHSQYLTAHQSLANYYTKTESDGKYLTAITKSMVEAVLTGNITTHTHNQYLTAHQSLANYMTRGEISDTYQTKSAALTFTAASGYVAARFTDAALATAAAQNYIELWGNDGWFNLQAGYLLAHGAVTATQFIRTGGTASQFLKADGSVDANTYLTPSNFASLITNVASATKLQTARQINGTAFDGTAAITTAKWGTARNITIGNTAKSVDGSAPVAWSLAEIGALAATANAVSASKLATPHTLWGQSFDGTDNVAGSLSGVEDILFNVNARLNATDNAFRFLTKGGGAQGIQAGNLLISYLFSDANKVPENGIYSKDGLVTDGSIKIGGGTITWDEATNSFIFSHTIASQGNVVAFKE